MRVIEENGQEYVAIRQTNEVNGYQTQINLYTDGRALGVWRRDKKEKGEGWEKWGEEEAAWVRWIKREDGREGYVSDGPVATTVAYINGLLTYAFEGRRKLNETETSNAEVERV